MAGKSETSWLKPKYLAVQGDFCFDVLLTLLLCVSIDFAFIRSYQGSEF